MNTAASQPAASYRRSSQVRITPLPPRRATRARAGGSRRPGPRRRGRGSSQAPCARLTSCGKRRPRPCRRCRPCRAIPSASCRRPCSRSVFSCAEGGATFMPFFLSWSRYQPVFSSDSFQPRVSASAAALSTASWVALSSASNAFLVRRSPRSSAARPGCRRSSSRARRSWCRSRSRRRRSASPSHRSRAPAQPRRPGWSPAARRRARRCARSAGLYERHLRPFMSAMLASCLLRVDALRRPWHGEEEHHALRAELRFERPCATPCTASSRRRSWWRGTARRRGRRAGPRWRS